MTAYPRETPQAAARRLAEKAIREGFQPEALHCYDNADGTPAYWRIRAKHPGGDKWIRPMYWNGSTYVLGEPPTTSAGKLLYRLPELAADPTRPVYVVEGEACADALAKLGLTATTSGSSGSADAADWAPLKGRSVRIWPDNDEAGARYADAVEGCLRALGCAVKRIDLSALGLPDKGDCVDWLALHPEATAADVAALPLVTGNEPIDGGPRVILHRGSEVEPLAVDWLWRGWLATGKLHLIGGATGAGKTTIAATLAATVTMGGRWPDGTRAEAGDVVIWSGEDDNADTMIPRLMAAGADLTRVHIVGGMSEDGHAYPFDPARDMDGLREALKELPSVRLIVIDPVVSAVSGDSHKNAEVRRGLQPLVDLARELRCALLGVTHFSKGTSGRDPVERITGSLAFGALARLVMVAAKQSEEGKTPERRVLLRAKSNIGPDGGGFVYTLEQGPLEGNSDIEASRVLWGEGVEGSARDVLAEVEAVDSDRSATDEAMEWLLQLLEAGPMPAGEVMKAAKLSGLSDKALRRARERLGIKPYKAGFQNGWMWALPKMPQLPEGAHSMRRASSAPSGGSRASSGDAVEVIEL